MIFRKTEQMFFEGNKIVCVFEIHTFRSIGIFTNLVESFIKGLINCFAQPNIWPLWSFQLIIHPGTCKFLQMLSSFKGKIFEENHNM